MSADNSRVGSIGESLSGEATHSRVLKIGGSIGGVILAGGAAYFQHRTGFLDAKLTPDVPVYDQITTGIVEANAALRSFAPYALAAGVGAQLAYRIKAETSPPALQIWEYSSHEYTVDYDANKRVRLPRVRKLLAGTALVASAVAFMGGSAAIEDEVSNGPNRPLDALLNDLGAQGGDSAIIVDDEGAMFMLDGRVSQAAIADLQTEVRDSATFVPFGKDLPNIQTNDKNLSGLVIGVGESTNAGETCEEVRVSADEAADVEVGEIIEINGVEAEVRDVINGTSSMNRVTAVTDLETYNNCIIGNPDAPYFGAVVEGMTVEETNNLIGRTEYDEDIVAITRDQFVENNRKFWQANGTPILLQEILYLGAFAGLAMAASLRNNLQRNIKEISTLFAMGVGEAQLKSIETLRALRRTLKSSVIAAPLVPLLAAGVNAAERGLQVGVSVRDVAVGYTVALASSIISARRAVRKFVKTNDPAEVLRG